MDTTQQNDDTESCFDCSDLLDPILGTASLGDIGIGILKASVWIACAGAIIFIKEKGYSNYYLMIPIAIAFLYTVYFCFRLKGYMDNVVEDYTVRLGGFTKDLIQ
jgi:hypothetical protein